MTPRWHLHTPDPETVRRLGSQLPCPPAVAAALVNRGVKTVAHARAFLDCSLSRLTDPMRLYGMAKAVARISGALDAGERIFVFGDYDVDGVSSTCLMVEFLRRCDAHVDYHIPHRLKEGYGLRAHHLNDGTIPEATSLIITVDCGIGGHEAVTEATGHGIDVIITDHHEPGATPPPAIAVIDPKQAECTAGLDFLAGVGVAFFLVIALRTHLRERGFWGPHRPEPNLVEYSDLVAMGTVADMVPLRADNRILARKGMEVMRRGHRPGLAALAGNIRTRLAVVRSEDISFRLAPPINAAGRMSHASHALDLLLSPDAETAADRAERLVRLNLERRKREQKILESAKTMISDRPATSGAAALVLADPDWHLGVIGVVAAHLANTHHRPVMLLTRNGDWWKGSGRSVGGIDLMACLKACDDCLHVYGGHAAAAGITVAPEMVARFSRRFPEAVQQLAPPRDTHPIGFLDGELPIAALTPGLADALSTLEPFGPENPEPLFTVRQVEVVSLSPLTGGHLRMTLRDVENRGSRALPAVYFNPVRPIQAGEILPFAVYRFHWNFWNGSRRLQILVEDLPTHV